MEVVASDMIARYDFRMLLRLCFDDDARHEACDLNDSAILQAAISDAYGEFRASLSVAGMYTGDQLDRLTPESAALAKRIVCEMALAFLYSRRGGESRETVRELRQSSEEYLDRLRKGERLFSIQESAVKEEAGYPSLIEPSCVELRNLNGITHRARTYFGNVASRQHIRRSE